MPTDYKFVLAAAVFHHGKFMYWNCSFFPLEWTVAQIVMLLKPEKQPEETKSYRPISLLPIPSKIYEFLLLQRILPILKEKELIPDHQFGFRSKHATIDQVHRLTKYIMESLEGADVQKKKWKNLKDTYFKEVADDKKLVSRQARKKKKRPYIHMRALSFLCTHKFLRDATNNVTYTENSTSNAEDLTNQSGEDTDSEVTQNKRLKASMRKKSKNLNNSDDELLKLLQEKKYDEDVSFCEMLIPMLKNLSIDQKHYAKI
ncbi:unnamed protein product [Parnassius apollo]|uniref:(apollo) hypothetical protein n=1 Tax=Parnassius apollo TaxID=110799 RepID=A0A8S3Y5X7_PARAO|nr:unnamed protein product [Parnassius apollo]